MLTTCTSQFFSSRLPPHPEHGTQGKTSTGPWPPPVIFLMARASHSSPLPHPSLEAKEMEGKQPPSARSSGRPRAFLDWPHFSQPHDKRSLGTGPRSKFRDTWRSASFSGSCLLPATNCEERGQGSRILWGASRLLAVPGSVPRVTLGLRSLYLHAQSLKDEH